MTEEEMLLKMRFMASEKMSRDRFRQSCWDELCDLVVAVTLPWIDGNELADNAMAALKAKVKKL